MTSLKRDVHLTQLMELIEVFTIMACIALFTDTMWCLRDIIVNGLTPGMFMILTGLSTATIITMLALCRYHRLAVKRILRERLNEKLKISKKCAKHKITIKRKGA